LFQDAIDFQYHTCGPSISIAYLSRREDSVAPCDRLSCLPENKGSCRNASMAKLLTFSAN
jgi:hypothetical protein